MSDFEYDPSMFSRCFLVDLSPLGLSAGEPTWQPESGVNGSWCDEKDSIERLFTGTRSLAAFSGSGVDGSVLLSGSWHTSPGTTATTPVSGASERTPLSRCCSSIIFFRYLPWASIRNCSCLCTCFTLKYKITIQIINQSVYSVFTLFKKS
ncbi:hypothetical protein V8G54_034365 [Vigna mungo]|uniref:Uncharacterized protein n=1 Tax=Vigna mungo TaxID=3915 RepID=A0AAQ3RJN2_VIGMU